jgi:hypothetical protein
VPSGNSAAAAVELLPPRIALTPALSPGERGNFSGHVVRRSSVDSAGAFWNAGGRGRRLQQRLERLRFETGVATTIRPRSFHPLPGGEGWGEGESRRRFAFGCCCDVFQAQREIFGLVVAGTAES